MQFNQVVLIGQGVLTPWMKPDENLLLHHAVMDPQENAWHVIYTVSRGEDRVYYHIVMDGQGNIHRLSEEMEP